MKNIKSKLLLIILVMFSFTFFMSIDKTKAIYRETKSTTISLTILDSSAYTVTFDSDGGQSYSSRSVLPNNPVGTLPVPTKTGFNFAGWNDQNGQRVYYNTLITADTDLTAQWVKIVCKKVTSDSLLHTEKCEQSAGNGCRKVYGADEQITYGFASIDNTPEAGDAYDCDVNNDGTYNAADPEAVSPETPKYTERFYFIKEDTSTDKAVLVYYTSYDELGRVNSQHRLSPPHDGGGSYNYTTALTHLPSTTDWSNPLLTTSNGKSARLISLDDIEALCGTTNNHTYSSNYLYTGDNSLKCQVLLENSRFQKETYGRAGNWISDYSGTTYHRIHTKTLSIATVESSSENTVRPVIEIPMLAMEGYFDEDEFTISFSTYTNDPNPLTGIKRYRGQQIGSNLPTPTREHYTFAGWYTDSGLQNAVDTTALVSGNMTLHAGWTATQTVTVTMHLDGGSITGITLDNNDQFTINTGDSLSNLADPTKAGYIFDGWYTDSGFNTSFDKTAAINSDIDLYAKWELGNYEARINNTYYATLALALADVPATGVKTRVTVLKNITLTTPATINADQHVELNLQEYTLDTSTKDLIQNSGTLDIINGTLKSTGSVAIGDDRGYIIANKSSGIVNISGGLLKYDNTAASEAKIIKNKGGTINITGGRLECNAVAAAIDNGVSGTINMSGGSIVSTGSSKGQAIYNEDSSTVNISGDAYLENKSASSGSNARGAVDNNSGTIRITGGTIVSTNYAAVSSRNADATTYIGIEDSGGNVIDTTTPILKGKQHAVIQTNGTINVYDGVYMSGQTGATSGTINKPTPTDFVQKGTESTDFGTLKVYYLAYTSGGPYTVTFDEANGNNTSTVSGLSALEKVTDNNTMPNNPTKANYIFEKWFIYKEVNGVAYDAGEFTGTTPVADDITVMAKWKPAIGLATISPGSISMNANDTATIIVTGPDGMESYTFASSDTSVATVDANGVVTGVAGGNTTITITGSESGDIRTVSVAVGSAPVVYHTVRFYDDVNGNVVKTTQVEHNTQIGSAGMPDNNPTKTNYVFDNWYVNGDTSTSAINATATVTANIDVIATYKEIAQYATVTTSPSPFVLTVGNTGTVSLTPTVQNDDVEAYSCSSSDTTVATVSGCTITAVGAGTATITITGTTSTTANSVGVTVNAAGSTHTVHFKLDANDVSDYDSWTVNHNDTLGALPTTPTKSGYAFAGWYTDSSPAVKINEEVVITAEVTFYAHWDKLVCYKATSLHTDGTNDFGELPANKTTIAGGFAYDCDVNGNDNIDTLNSSLNNADSIERFYYLATDENGYAALIFYNNTHQNNGTLQYVCGADGLIYSSTPTTGPVGSELPTTSQWTNVSLHSTPRQLYNENGTTTFGNSTLSTTSYSGKAARFATTQEIAAATGIAVADFETIGILSNSQYSYLFENLKVLPTLGGSSCRSNYWLENPKESGSAEWRMDGDTGRYRIGNANGGSSSKSATRPVIEVPTRLIEGFPLTHSVSFDSQGGSSVVGWSVADGAQVGTLPSAPTKADNVFVGWFTAASGGTEVTSTRVIHDDVVFYAHWAPTINQATISPSNTTINIYVGGTQQITITPVTDMESYTITSSNSSIASVDTSTNTITGVSAGTTTVVITGSLSNETITYTVNVESQIVGNTIVFDPDNGSSETTHNGVADGTLLSTLIPSTNPTKQNYIFDNWYLYDTVNEVLTSTEINPDAEISGDMTFKAKWAPSGTVCKMNGTYYATVQDAVNAAPAGNTAAEATQTTIYLMDDVSVTQDYILNMYDTTNGANSDNNLKNIVLDMQGHWFRKSSSVNSNFYILRTKGILEIKNGNIEAYGGKGAVEADTGGTLIIDNMNIEAKGNRQGVYNDGGNIIIRNGSVITATAAVDGSNKRGTVQNKAGTMTILDATITSTYDDATYPGIALAIGGGTVTIGSQDNAYSTSSIIIRGYGYGIYTTKNISLYDGLIEGVSDSINVQSRITATESNSTKVDNGTETIGNYTYKKLYYTLAVTPPATYTIVLNGHGGTFSGNSTTSKEFNVGTTITASDLLPEPTKGIYTFDGWYTDSDALTSPVSFPYTIPSTAGTTTFFAKWTYVASNQIVDVNTMSNALQTYFTNINTWKNGTESQLNSNLSSTFSTNNCSACDGDNSCNTRYAGTYCEQPQGYDTGMGSSVSVYLSDAVNKTKGAAATYVTSVNGVLYNLIPGQVYYWELDSDPNVHGLVRSTETRRTIYSTVGNVRDLGGLSVSYEEDGHTVTGTIDYGRLYRGAKITSSADVSSLTQLGVTREIDLRSTSEAGNVPKFSSYDYTDPNAQNGYQDIVVTNYIVNPEAISNYSYIDNSGNPQTVVPAHPDEYAAMKDAMKKVMNYIINDDDNIFFHCTIGTDRTGTMAYLLEGLLGVSEEDRVEDYEMTYFYGLSNRTRYHDHYGNKVNPRFMFLHLTYPSNSAIYSWFTNGDTQAEKAADDALITAFRNAMIVNKTIS